MINQSKQDIVNSRRKRKELKQYENKAILTNKKDGRNVNTK